MKNTIRILSIYIAMCCAACSKPSAIVNESDYAQYLVKTSDSEILKLESEQEFWLDKFNNAPQQTTYLIKLAQIHGKRFSITAEIEQLKKAEELLLKANSDYKGLNVAVHQSLARNFISQHRFNEAYDHLIIADSIGQSKMTTVKMLFDVQMELGKNDEALASLEQIRNDQDFDYLIRLAKWQDSEGRLENAIESLEKASIIAKDWNDKDLILWSYSNLADFYGHAGRIEDSYTYYLKTLEIDPNYTYALKGIAWIAFSHDNNINAATDILLSLKSKSTAPDYDLILGQIAEHQGNQTLAGQHYSDFIRKSSSPIYGAMYNAYLIELYIERENFQDALTLAQMEVENRPTPESWALMAMVCSSIDENITAEKIIRSKVLGHTEEPKAMLICAKILKNNGHNNESASIQQDLFSSAHELGPNKLKQLKTL